MRRLLFSGRELLPSGIRIGCVIRSSKGTTVFPAHAPTRIVKDADNRRVAPLDHAHNAAHAAAIGLGRLDLDQHLIALHGAVDLVGRDEDVVFGQTACRALGRTKP